MRFLTEEPARLYTNQKPIPLQIEGKKYHVSLVYERNETNIIQNICFIRERFMCTRINPFAI